MFFGLWLLPLGYLVIKSRDLPKILGILLMVGCFAYLADLFSRFLAPDVATTIAPFVAIAGATAELSFAAWLLVKGIKASKPVARVPAMAESGGML
jgi:hypothetical protein